MLLGDWKDLWISKKYSEFKKTRSNPISVISVAKHFVCLKKYQVSKDLYIIKDLKIKGHILGLGIKWLEIFEIS